MATIAEPSEQKAPAMPRVGMVATVRNRRGIISGVEPFDGPAGRLHLVRLEYHDGYRPLDDELIWEIEPHRHVIEPAALLHRRGGPVPVLPTEHPPGFPRLRLP